MKALLIGATGATGKDVLDLLLEDSEVEQVEIFVRRDLNLKHEKLKIHLIDFDKPTQWKALVNGDVLFSCLGTTLKTAGSKKEQWKIDYGYQYEFAKIAKENNVDGFVLVSSIGASSKSNFFYPKMKGQLEDDVRKLNFLKLIIFNPTLLIREKTERNMEIWGAKIIRFFNKFGLLNSQKPISTKQLAEAMIKSVKILPKGTYSIVGKEILEYGEENK